MSQELEAQLFKHGPLYPVRFQIMEDLKRIGLKTGDVLYRASDAVGPLGIPFSRLVSKLTKSPYSHAAIVLIENEEVYVLEINDQGTLKLRMIDWLDTCYTHDLSIHRLKNVTRDQIESLEKAIRTVLMEDPEYDFNFVEPDKFYCTESIVEIYSWALGVKISDGDYIRDIVPRWVYCLIIFGSFLSSFFGASLPLKQKLYYVGNKEKGMMASELMEEIYSLKA